MNEPFDLGRAVASAQNALSEDRIDEADALCNLILQNRPAFPPAEFFLAVIASKRGDNLSAIERLRAIVRADPNALEAADWLANLLREHGEFEESMRLSAHLIRMRPGNPGALSSMGLTCLAAGQAFKAVEFLQQAVTLAPNIPAFHFQLAQALEQLGRIDDSAAEYLKAITIVPNAAMLHEALGRMLYQSGSHARGLEHLKKAVELTPTRDGLILLATSLADDGKHAEAEPHFVRAIQIDPYSALSYEQFGYTLQILGRFDEAEQNLNRSVELDPAPAGPYLGIASLKKMTEADLPFIAQLEAIAADTGRTKVDLRKINYALGKAFAEVGQFEHAMQRFDLANEYAFETFLKRVPFDRKVYREWIDAQISIFTPEFFRKHRNLGSDSQIPILVVGMVRSGTTLTDQILCSHPQIRGAGELMYWLDPPRTDLIRPLLAGRLFPAELRAAAIEYLELLEQSNPGSPRVTDKMPLNFTSLGLVHLLFPNARIIHSRRNPIDTCLSVYMTPFEGGSEFFYDRQSIVDAYREYQRMMAHWRKTLPQDRFLEIDYEELVRDKEAVTRTMVSFCGLEWDDVCMRHQENTRSVRTPSWWQVRQPVYSTSIDRWRVYEPWLREFEALLVRS